MKTKNYVNKKHKNSLPEITGKIQEKLLGPKEIQKYKSLLEKDGEKYTNDEIEIIYLFLKEMAELSISHYLKTNKYEESDFNVKGEFR